MQHKVIVVLVDGLAAEVAHTMGYLGGMVEAGRGLHTTLNSALPSLSRPLYECILTGVPPVVSGITHNGVSRLSLHDSIFHLARAAGKRTAAAAYYWVSELYNQSPWLAARDRFTHDEQLPIQHGCFYWDDNYPDSHLLMDGEWLRTQYDPDFLLIHPMGWMMQATSLASIPASTAIRRAGWTACWPICCPSGWHRGIRW